jgi:hypothetical protein
VRNDFGPVAVHAEPGPLGSSLTRRPSIAAGEKQTYEVVVPAGASRLDVTIGNPSDPAADLDLLLIKDGAVVASSGHAASKESVSLADPIAGTYQVQVNGFSVPSGSTQFDYRDVFFSTTLGNLQVPATVTNLVNRGRLTISGTIVAITGLAEGRQLAGVMTVVTDRDAVIGRGAVQFTKIN